MKNLRRQYMNFSIKVMLVNNWKKAPKVEESEEI